MLGSHTVMWPAHRAGTNASMQYNYSVAHECMMVIFVLLEGHGNCIVTLAMCNKSHLSFTDHKKTANTITRTLYGAYPSELKELSHICVTFTTKL